MFTSCRKIILHLIFWKTINSMIHTQQQRNVTDIFLFLNIQNNI